MTGNAEKEGGCDGNSDGGDGSDGGDRAPRARRHRSRAGDNRARPARARLEFDPSLLLGRGRGGAGRRHIAAAQRRTQERRGGQVGMSRRRRRSRKKRAMRSRTEQAGRGEGGGGADYSGLTRHDRPSRPLAIRGCRKHARAALDIPPCRLQQPTMHPSHVSGPHRVLHRRPQWQGPHAFPHISTSISVHPSHVSWPHRELHLRPQWQGPHAVPPPFRRAPHTFRGPIGSYAEGHSGRARMQVHPQFVAPLTRFVAP